MELTVQATLTGIHPRSEELVQATRDADRGRATPQALAEARRRDAQALVGLQAKAGFTHVSDGLLAFQDIFRPFAERVKGAQVGPLTRWYENNTFFRQPVVHAPLQRTQPVLEPYLEKVALPKGHPWKVVVPGPWTFARLVEDKAYGAPEKLLGAYAREVLAPEVRALAKAGVGWVQFQEPHLLRERPAPEAWEALEKAYLGILDGVKITSSVAAFFGDATRLLPDLASLPVDYLGVDLTETPLDAFEGYDAARGLQLGVVDGRSSLVEKPGDVVATVEELREIVDLPALVLAPSCDLEFLPRGIADEKLLALGEAARALEESA